MKEIVIISGKGGVGKTTVSAALSVLLQKNGLKIVAVDADVDAPNLGIILKNGGRKATLIEVADKSFFIPENCVRCGKCVETCKFDAIVQNNSEELPEFISLFCEGCGVCSIVCPTDAIEIRSVKNGRIVETQTKYGFPLISGELEIGETGSGKIVEATKTKGREYAKKLKADVLLVDGAPGVGCPVIAALSGANYAIAVTEPTPAARYDLERVLFIAKHFNCPCGLILNKANIHEPTKKGLLEFANNSGIDLLGEIPLDNNVPFALANAMPIIDFDPECPASKALIDISKVLYEMLESDAIKAP